MPTQNGIKIVMGGYGPFAVKPAVDAPRLLSTLQRHNVNTIDTAVIYLDSEEVLGLNDAGGKGFILDTKIPGGFVPGTATRDTIIGTVHSSLEKLKIKQVNVLYIHAPDPSIPFEETLGALNTLYEEDTFKRLGVSNFSPEELQDVFEICESKGFIKPSVYQGQYNAFARTYEETLLPLLRKHSMKFYSYSPMAGGFLSKTSELITGMDGKGEGRFLGNEPASELYRALYAKPVLLEGLNKWNEIAAEAGLKPGHMAVRWVRYNSGLKNEHGDALIIGGRTVEQIDEMLEVLAGGPLDEDVVRKIDQVWELVKHDAPVDTYHKKA